MTDGATGLVNVTPGSAVFVEDHHEFGPYTVDRECERLPQGWPLLARDLPPSGRCAFTVSTSRGEATCIVHASLNAAPVEVRRGIEADLPGGSVRAKKTWFTPVRVRGGDIDWRISRRGLSGWRMVDHQGDVVAEYRWGRLRIDGGLEPSTAALAIGLIETRVPDSVSLLQWIQNI